MTEPDGSKRCTAPANQAFVESTLARAFHGINRPVDGKFGPDGAFYLVDFGITRDGGESTPASAVVNSVNAPIVQTRDRRHLEDQQEDDRHSRDGQDDHKK